MIQLKHVCFSYEYGEEKFSVTTSRSISSDLVKLDISMENNIFSASAHLYMLTISSLRKRQLPVLILATRLLLFLENIFVWSENLTFALLSI